MKNILLILSIFVFTVSCHGVMSYNSDNPAYQAFINNWVEIIEGNSASIAFYGDSRVAGADWKGAYPSSDVVNLGVGGDKVNDLIFRMPLIDALDVKYCFLAIGGNDALSSAFRKDFFIDQYETLIAELKSRDITIFVNTIAPIRESNLFNSSFKKWGNENIQIANEIIKELAKKHNLTLIDIAPLMTDTDGCLKLEYSSDGIHFTPEGNQLWFDTLRPYVEKL